MGKVKTRKSVAKRFKVTGTGKITFRHQMRRHLRRKKSSSNLRAKSIKGEMTGAFAKKIKQMVAA